MLTVLRILVGLVTASLAAAGVLVAHTIPAEDLLALSGQPTSDRAVQIAELVALLTTQVAFFVLPFGVLAAVVAEANRLRGVLTYAVIGLVFAGAAFYLHVAAEDDLRTMVNPLAAQVFVLQGLIGALVYWLIAGRLAGGRPTGPVQQTTPLPIERSATVEDADASTVRPARPAA